MKNKKYIKGSAKQSEWGTISVSIPATELRPLVNEKGYVNFYLGPRKEVGQYGETHSIYVLDKSEEQAKAAVAPKPAPKPQGKPAPVTYDDELPF